MSNEEQDLVFRQIADKVIDLANDHLAEYDPVFVSTALLFGVSRFCAFAAASQAETVDQFQQDKKPAAEYYRNEYSRMLTENLEDYETHLQSTLKYGHLMKPSNE